jgi:hypothetical protein
MGEELQRFLGMAFLLLHAQEPTGNKVAEPKSKAAKESDTKRDEKSGAKPVVASGKRCA